MYSILYYYILYIYRVIWNKDKKKLNHQITNFCNIHNIRKLPLFILIIMIYESSSIILCARVYVCVYISTVHPHI